MRRRRLLASLAAAGTAGCLELESEDSTAGGPTTAQARATTPPKTGADTTGDGTGARTDAQEPTEEETTTEEPREYTDPLWTFDPGTELNQPPVVVDDVVIAGTEDDSAHAVAVEDGSERWVAEGKPFGERRRPVVVGNTVVFPGFFETTALAAADGRERWRNDAQMQSQPAVDGGTMYAYGFVHGKQLGAIDVDTGRVPWSRETEPTLGGARSTAVVDGVVVDADEEDAVYGFDAANGDVLWSYSGPTAGTGLTDVATDGVRIVAAYRDNESGGAGPLVALDPTDGSVRWSRHEDDDVLKSSPVLAVHDGTLYVHHRGLHAVNPTDGSTKWFNDEVRGIVTPGTDALYVGSGSNDGVVLSALDPDYGGVTRRVRAEYPDAWSRRPAVADGVAYVVETTPDGNRLAAYSLAE